MLVAQTVINDWFPWDGLEYLSRSAMSLDFHLFFFLCFRLLPVPVSPSLHFPCLPVCFMSSFLWLPIVFWRLCPGTACCFYFPCLFFFCPHYCLIWLTNALLPLWIFQQSLCQVISLSSCIFPHVSWVCFSYHLFGFPVLFPLGFLKIHSVFFYISFFLQTTYLLPR